MKHRATLLMLVMTVSLLTGSVEQLEVANGVQSEFTGGESDSVAMKFVNSEEREVPVVVNVSVSSDKGISGQEFTVAAAINSSNATDNRYTVLECSYSRRGPLEGSYWCSAPQYEVVSSSDRNSLLMDLAASPYIAPGEYNISVDILDMIGIPEATNTSSTPVTTVRAGKGEATVNSSSPVNVSVRTYDRFSIPGPGGRKVVGGIEVDAGEEKGGFRLSYTEESVSGIDENSLRLYRFNFSGKEWEPVSGESYTVDKGNNTVTASVERFSVYGVYGDGAEDSGEVPVGDDDDGDDSESGGGAGDGGIGESSEDQEDSGKTETCTEDDWECTEWSACEGGVQSRECRKTAECSLEGFSPLHLRSCEDETRGNETVGTSGDTGQERDETGQTDDDTGPAGPTGLFGAAQSGIPFLLFLLALVGAGIYHRERMKEDIQRLHKKILS